MANESRFALRLPTELYEQIRADAEQRNKSINEHIVFVLSDYLNLKSNIEKRIEELEKFRAEFVAYIKKETS